MSSQSRNPNSSSNPINEQKEHYESLISLFKYSISLITVLISIIGFTVSYITYTNGKDMREDFNQQKIDLKANISDMRARMLESEAELKTRQAQVQNNIKDLVIQTRDEVELTKSLAISQIGNIKTMATDQARERIDQVFKDRNFDQFVEVVAKKRMEPQIQEMVDRKIKQIEHLDKDRLDQSITDLASNDQSIWQLAIDRINTSPYQKISENQYSRIIDIVDKKREDNNFRAHVNVILLYKDSPVLDKHFQRLIIDQGFDRTSRVSAINYFMKTGKKQDLEFYKEVLKRNQDPFLYSEFIVVAMTINKELTLALLNDKPIVDFVKLRLSDEQLQRTKETLISNFHTVSNVKNSEYRMSYFFSGAL
jgi:hypothetical protein